MVDLFNCVAPSRADASTLLDFDNLYDRLLCSSTVLAVKVLMVNFLRVAALAFDLAFRLALLLVPVWVIVTGVQAFLSWAEQYREKVEMQEEESTEEQSELGPEVWYLPRRDAEGEQFEDSASPASYEVNRSLSTTPVHEPNEEEQELHRRKAKLNEVRDGFEQVYPDIGPRIYGERRYQAYRQERAIVTKAFREIRRAQSPQSDTVPGRLRREGAVTRSAFLNGDTRPREECFDSDEETACGDD